MRTLRGYGQGGYAQTGSRAIADALAGLAFDEFRMGSMTGTYVSAPFYAPGSQLPADWSRTLETRVNVGAVEFVIWSYATPIAWFDSEAGWIVPDESYSATTSKQQSNVRVALAHNGRDYSE